MLACQSCNEWRQKGNQIKYSHNGYAVGGPVNIPKPSDRGFRFLFNFYSKNINGQSCESACVQYSKDIIILEQREHKIYTWFWIKKSCIFIRAMFLGEKICVSAIIHCWGINAHEWSYAWMDNDETNED
jgi:hypothetical protein